MSIERAKEHLRQLAPHARERDTAKHLAFCIAEIDGLSKALTTAISTLERDGDEWGICDHLRERLKTPNAKLTGSGTESG